MANSLPVRRTRRGRQRGAALVEMAIVVSLFCTLLFAIFEFALAIFDWSRVVEATRAGARYAIVNDVEPGCAWDPTSCPGAAAVSCNLSSGSPTLLQMQRIKGNIGNGGDDGRVQVTYACADVGFANRPEAMKITQVTVETSGVKHVFVVPTMLGIESTLTIPAFATSRVGEDLDTPG